MATKSSVPKKDAQGQKPIEGLPIELLSDKIIRLAEEYWKIIAIAAGAVVLVFAISLVWMSHNKTLNEKALLLEAEALKLHKTVEEDINKKTDVQDNSSQPAENPYQKVFEKYQQIIDQYSGTASAIRAGYILGGIAYDMGKYADAQKYFNGYLAKQSKGTLAVQAEISLGYILEQQKEFQKAIDQLKQVESKADSSQKAQILLAIGRNHEQLKQTNEAVAVYQQIVDSNTSSSWKETALERLNTLQPNRQAVQKAPESSPTPKS